MKKALVISIILVICLWGTAGWAKEPDTPEIKLTEAIDLAMKNSDSLKKAALDVDKNKEKQEKASDKLDFIPALGSTYDAATESNWYGLISADINWQMSKKSYSSEQDRLTLDVCQKYWNVQKSLESVRSKKISAAVAELAFRRAQAMVRLGMTPPEYPAGSSPQSVLEGAEGSLISARSDLTKAQNKLNSDYEALNQLIGLWPEDRPQLVDQVTFESLKVDNLDAEIQRAVEKSPKIWQAKEKITLAKLSHNLMYASGSYTPYKVREIEKEQAQIDAISAEDAVRLATRSLYYTVMNLEAGLPAAENAVAAAEEALRVAKIQYELGMITKESLKKTEASLVQAQYNLMDLKQQHLYAKLAFQKPWAVSAAG